MSRPELCVVEKEGMVFESKGKGVFSYVTATFLENFLMRRKICLYGVSNGVNFPQALVLSKRARLERVHVSKTVRVL